MMHNQGFAIRVIDVRVTMTNSAPTKVTVNCSDGPYLCKRLMEANVETKGKRSCIRRWRSAVVAKRVFPLRPLSTRVLSYTRP